MNDIKWTAGPISLDGWGMVRAQYDPAQRWNGYLASPFLDAWSVVEILEATNWEREPAQPRHWWFAEDGALFITDPDSGDEDHRDVVFPDEDGLYPLGAYAWVWVEE